MKKLFIFDLDGTLLDTVADLGNSCNHVLAEAGYPTHKIDAYYNFVGNGVSRLIERALPENASDVENVHKLLFAFREYYDCHMADCTKPYNGITELLALLQRKGVLLAVASNKYQSATENLVRKYFPNIRFDVVLGQRDGIPVKPHPAIVNDICNITFVEKADVMYIGDSLVDFQTAENSEVEFTAVTWGFCPRERLVEKNPDHIVDNVKELEVVLMND